MPKILTIVGARPQFVKAAALSRALKKFGIEEILVHTGQHFDEKMSEIFFRQMAIPQPKYNLGINSLSHGAMTGRMLEEIEKVIIEEKPSVLVVFGDTNSTLAGALAASKLHIPVAHIEAGLRSFNMKMPEEVNRILADRISEYLFCPNENAITNLKKEGFENFGCQIFNCGDVMYDVALYYSHFSAQHSTIISELKLDPGKFLLTTLHRQENTDDPAILESLIFTLNELSGKYKIVLPIHPRTRKIIESRGLKLNFNPIDPVGYFDMIELLKHCAFVISDSGGLQKEAFFFEKHCLVIRNETEWTELVELGYNFLTGTESAKILETVEKLADYKMQYDKKPYGEGNAAEKIALVLKNIN